MSFDPMLRPAIVVDEDRQWAIAKKPSDWDVRSPLVEWEDHVAEQAERFEAYFGEARKPYAEWSGLWRRVWWPKADPAVLHPGKVKSEPVPFARRGQPGFAAAIAVATDAERAMFERFGVAQFKAADPRSQVIAGART